MHKLVLFALVLASAFSIGDASAADPGPQTSSARGVSITVTPRDMSRAATSWDFEVVFLTHIHPLTEDLSTSSELIAGGKRYKPRAWVGTPRGGHHRKGILAFRPVTPRPHSIELQIRLNGENAPRRFVWILGNGK